MKIATWNVNGIRARAAQLREWLERERPDVVCLQELKAEATQIPDECKLPGYHHYWHCLKGYSGVSLHVREGLFAAENPGLVTWWAPWRNLRARNIGWRLDYVLASPAVAERAVSCVVQAEVGTSDHAPVMMAMA